jgi:hypothetical protein
MNTKIPSIFVGLIKIDGIKIKIRITFFEDGRLPTSSKKVINPSKKSFNKFV